MTRTVIGVDPGKKGSIAILYVDERKLEFLDINLPPDILIGQLMHIRESTDLLGVAIEQVHAIPGAGATSTFNFGFNYGVVTAVLYSVTRTIFKISPRLWQNFIELKVNSKLKGVRRRKEIKRKVAGICKTFYPDTELYGSRGGLLDGRSDAAMIAHMVYHKYLKH